MKFFFALGAFLVVFWGIRIQQKWANRNFLLRARVCGCKNKASFLNFRVKKTGQKLSLILRPFTLRGMSQPDVLMSFEIRDPEGNLILKREREKFTARRLGNSEIYDYTRRFSFTADERGQYSVRIEVLSDFVGSVSVGVAKE